MQYEKYLPIGTVVILKGGTKRVMITGFCSSSDEKIIYDYSGCLYPEGLLSSNQALLFNHDQIDKIYHVGYQDEEEKNFKQQLKKLINELDNKKDDIEIIG